MNKPIDRCRSKGRNEGRENADGIGWDAMERNCGQTKRGLIGRGNVSFRKRSRSAERTNEGMKNATGSDRERAGDGNRRE
mmetsp:Transcript_7634/g.16226  ORF Transcript_7634/g.16226 Transcript_7634/m.16226 type:complete len:80 (-) Transcript_7634:32-271(-)